MGIGASGSIGVRCGTNQEAFMASGNGADLGTIVVMLDQVLKAQEQLRSGQEQLRSELKTDIASLRTELKAEISSVRTELKADISVLRQEVTDYHGSVMGHGILLTELQARMERVEGHLGLPPISPH